MKKNLFALVCPLVILCVLTVRYFSDFRTFQSGVSLLLPVWVEKIEKDSFSSWAKIRYYNFIPAASLTDKTGSVIISRSDDGQADYVEKPVKERLHSRELRLKYVIVPSSFFRLENQSINVRFASSGLRFFDEGTLQASDVRYAVVHLNDRGGAFLVGLADNAGTQLVKSLTIPVSRKP